MIQIDLLPDKNIKHQLKKNLQIELPELPYSIVFLGSIIIILLVYLMLSSVIGFQRGAIAKLDEQFANKGLDADKIARLSEEVKVLEAEVVHFRNIGRPPFLISEKMNRLSDMMPEHIWLTDFQYSQNSFKLSGTEVVRPGKATQVWGFMKLLKNDERFYTGINDMKLSYTKRKMIGKTEVEDFMIFFSLQASGEPQK